MHIKDKHSDKLLISKALFSKLHKNHTQNDKYSFFSKNKQLIKLPNYSEIDVLVIYFTKNGVNAIMLIFFYIESTPSEQKMIDLNADSKFMYF